MNLKPACVQGAQARAFCFKCNASVSFLLGQEPFNCSVQWEGGGLRWEPQGAASVFCNHVALSSAAHSHVTKRHQPQVFPTFSLLEPNFSSSTRHRLSSSLPGPPLKSFCFPTRFARHSGTHAMDLQCLPCTWACCKRRARLQRPACLSLPPTASPSA